MVTIKKKSGGVVPLFCLLTLAIFLNACRPALEKAAFQGIEHLEGGRYSQAVESLQNATRLAPTEARLWNHLGLAYHQSGDLTKAIQAYQQALILNRNLLEARLNLAMALKESGQYSLACDSFSTYTALQPKSAEAWLNLGWSQLRFSMQQSGTERGRTLDAARRSFEQSLTNGAGAAAYNGLGLVAFQRSRAKEAQQLFQNSMAHDPGYAPAIFNTAYVLQNFLNDKKGATEKFRLFTKVSLNSGSKKIGEQYLNALESETVRENRTTQTYSPSPFFTNIPLKGMSSLASNEIGASSITNSRAGSPAPTSIRTTPLPVKSAIASKPGETRLYPMVQPTSTVVAHNTNVARIETPAPKKQVLVTPLPGESPLQAGKEIESGRKPVPLTNFATLMTNRPIGSGKVPEKDQARDKTGILQKINPSTWFKTKPSSPQSPERFAVLTNRLANAPVPREVEPAPTPTAPAIKSYRYSNPTAPQVGDRQQAAPHFRKGFEAQKNNQLPLAIQSYQQSLARDPSSFEANFNLGLAAFDHQDYPVALDAYEMALAISPTSVEARQNFGATLERAGHFIEATAEYEKTLAIQADNNPIRLQLANLYAQKLGRKPEARSLYQKILASEPKHPQAGAIRYWLATNP